MPARSPDRAAFGDFQTPPALAAAVVARLVAEGVAPAHVVEPTVGVGNLLAAARDAFPRATLFGLDLAADKIAAARARLGDAARLEVADCFTFDWDALARARPGRVLLLGNPPWITSAALTSLARDNLPAKRNHTRLAGLDARTGRANFDISEWIVLRLLRAFASASVEGALLLKTAVARRLLEEAHRADLPLRDPCLVALDAGRHFGAAVDACLLRWRSDPRGGRDARLFAGLDVAAPHAQIGVREGGLVADVAAYEAARGLLRPDASPWRSGVKHDCAAVMELRRLGPGRYQNAAGQTCDLEDALVFPLAKGADLARERGPSRWVLLPQRSLGEDTRELAGRAPRTWRYLQANARALASRRSAIYRDRPPAAIFGVGEYTFAPWKVAVSGLHKRPRFALLGPHEGRPVVLDDTSYFLAFADEPAARGVHQLLSGEPAQQALRALVFWDAKRPLTKSILGRLDLDALARQVERSRGP